MKPVEVRSELTDALKLDLVGPNDRLGSPTEVLPQAPSRWYLTGFLVPIEAETAQRVEGEYTGLSKHICYLPSSRPISFFGLQVGDSEEGHS